MLCEVPTLADRRPGAALSAHAAIRAAETKAENEERVISQAIDLMADWEDTYRRADPDIRQRLNQVFFANC